MPIGKSVRSLLVNNAAVAALVGARVYPLRAPQNASLPFVIYLGDVGEDITYSADGETGLVAKLMQFDSYATTYDVAVDLDDKIRLVLSGYSGTVGGIVIRSILKSGSAQDLTEETTDKREHPIVRISSDYEVTCDQTVP